MYEYRTYPVAIILDDPHTEPMTAEQRALCLSWWEKHLERSIQPMADMLRLNPTL